MMIISKQCKINFVNLVSEERLNKIFVDGLYEHIKKSIVIFNYN